MPTSEGCQERTGVNWDRPEQTGTQCNSFYRSLKGRKLANGSKFNSVENRTKNSFSSKY